jgi:hypothetical protein
VRPTSERTVFVNFDVRRTSKLAGNWSTTFDAVVRQ